MLPNSGVNDLFIPLLIDKIFVLIRFTVKIPIWLLLNLVFETDSIEVLLVVNLNHFLVIRVFFREIVHDISAHLGFSLPFLLQLYLNQIIVLF